MLALRIKRYEAWSARTKDLENGEWGMGNRERSLDLKPIPQSLFPDPDSLMRNARIKQGLILATLAALVSGCSTWEGPRAKVEDRRPSPDRPKAVVSKPTSSAGAGVSQAPTRKETAKQDISVNAPGAHAGADVISGDHVLDMKPSRSR